MYESQENWRTLDFVNINLENMTPSKLRAKYYFLGVEGEKMKLINC
jgi:hypothetical protein